MGSDGPIQLILIDDNQTFLNVAVHYLERQPGVNVAAAETRATEALRRVQTQRPDCVLLDLDMPEMGGLEAIARFHQVDPALAVIVLSVHDSACDQLAAQQAGAACFVSKQNLHTDLMPAIRRLSAETRTALPAG